MDRRRFCTAVPPLVLGASIMPRGLMAADGAADPDWPEWRRESLMAALREEDGRYGEEEKMLRSRVSGVGYHTTLSDGFVHHTRGSLRYATALLDSGEPWRIQRAIDILHRVIPLQDQDPDSRTYGIWSWYLEEPLEKMSPPDFNWADFNGVQLLAVWIDHRDKLDSETQNLVSDSIRHAARSIRKRNMGPGYTNIAVMGTYVTLTTGERFDWPDMLEYAKERLRRLHRFTIHEQGSFNEYNSSTYSVVAIAELTRMLMHFGNEEDRELAAEIHDLAWKHVATHFHAPTKQWSGPQSRCYSTNLHNRSETLAFLEAATGRTGRLMDADPLPLGIEYSRLPVNCPEAHRHFFFELNEPRQVVETFIKRDNRPDTAGTTYLHPLYSLGSVNAGDFWVQRRPLLAFWGDAQRCHYLQARFLHDDYDFTSAIPVTRQEKNRSVTAVAIATNYGDTHPSLDRVRDGTIQARDLRLRIEIGISPDSVEIDEIDAQGKRFVIRDGRMNIFITPMESRFGETAVKWETGGADGKKWIDAICLSEDGEKPVNLTELREAFLAFALEFCPAGDIEQYVHPETKREPASNSGNARFTAAWEANGVSMRLGVEIPAAPDELSKIYQRSAWI